MKASINENNLQRKEDLSVEELKAVKCFKGLSEEKLLEAIKTIKQFTSIVYDVFAKEVNRVDKENKVISINKNITKSKAA